MQSLLSQVQPAGKLSVEDFELQRVIGRGSFGEVRLCRQKKTGNVYAIKVLLKREVLKRNQVEQVWRTMATDRAPVISLGDGRKRCPCIIRQSVGGEVTPLFSR